MHPALRFLLVAKFRGLLRRQRARLRKPTGWLMALAGVLALSLWIGALLWRGPDGALGGLSPQRLTVLIQTSGLVFTLMTVLGALGHRGLYLPREEIELLFAAPLARADVVRYRLAIGFARSSFGALVLGLVAWRRLPSPGLGLLGIFLAAQTLPVLGQTVSILVGDAENRLHGLISGRLRGVIKSAAIGLVVAAAVGIGALVVLDRVPGLREFARSLGLQGGLASLLDQPWLARAGLPLRPWARMIAAPDLAAFAPWFGVCLGVALGLYALVVRLDVDFRELSLATSADVARRLLRRRKTGGVASGTRAASGSAQWRVPWLFGRGPAGAIAWRKTGSILRKARGTVLTSLLIVGGLTLGALVIDRNAQDGGLAGSLLIGGVGALYLCAGLRFDFREDLDLMEAIKAWPVRPWRSFLATLLPEVVLVSGLLAGAILLRRLPSGSIGVETWTVALAVPIATLMWVAIDNAVFLFLPVRFTPGQEGALQHVGRGVALLLLRMLAFGFALAGAAAALASHLLLRELDWSALRAGATAVALFALVVSFEVVAVIAIGGRMLARFDVARDRG